MARRDLDNAARGADFSVASVGHHASYGSAIRSYPVMIKVSARRRTDDGRVEFSITVDTLVTDAWLSRDQTIMRLGSLGVDDPGALLDSAVIYGFVHIHRDRGEK